MDDKKNQKLDPDNRSDFGLGYGSTSDKVNKDQGVDKSLGDQTEKSTDVKKEKEFPGAPYTPDRAAVLAPDDTFPGSGPNVPGGTTYE